MRTFAATLFLAFCLCVLGGGNAFAMVQASRLNASNGVNNDQFGNNVAVSGNLAVVGSWEATYSGGAGKGAAYVYDITNPAAPVQKSILTASDGANGDGFGESVAVSGTLAVVGAYIKTVGANTFQGAAYVFDLTDPANPVQKSRLTASDGVHLGSFSTGVAISGNIAVIGSYGATVGSNLVQGAMYVFDLTNPAAPVQKSKLVASDGVASDGCFRDSVAISGNLVIGACSLKNSNKGVAYVYDITDPANPVQKSIITASDGVGGDQFGASVAMSGNLAVVGAVQANSVKGAAYVYDLTDPANPVQKSKLTASNGANSDQFGHSVAMSGNLAMVGAANHQVGSNAGQGTTYAYDLTNPAAPVEQSKLTASDGGQGERFGYSVAMSGGIAVMGAYAATYSGGLGHGAAYVFSSQSNCAGPPKLGSTGEVEYFSSSHKYQYCNGASWVDLPTSTAGACATEGEIEFDTGINNFKYCNGSKYKKLACAQRYDANNWATSAQKTESKASDGGAFDSFGSSVAVSGNLMIVGAYDATVNSTPSIGTVCGDGSVYAGLSTDGNIPMSTTRCDAGLTWNGTTCTGTISIPYWQNGTGTTVGDGINNADTGQANSAAIAALADAESPHQAAQLCENLNIHGHTDWYLPSRNEMTVIGTNRVAIGNFTNSLHWTSDEAGVASQAWSVTGVGTQTTNFNWKNLTQNVRCARHGACTNTNQGAAYVFDITDPANPVQVAKLVAPDGSSSDYFGYSVAISGTMAVVGAYQQTVSGHTTQGAAYVFDLSDPANPVTKWKLTASDGAVGDNFGSSVAISGGTAVVGAYWKANGANTKQGAAYVYTNLSPNPPCCILPGALTETSKILTSDGAINDYFGSSVTMSGNLAIIGAPDKTIGANASQGAAYVYDLTTPATPVFKSKLTASDGATAYFFGNSVSLSGTVAVVGARSTGANGAAYVFDLSGTPPAAMTQTSKITASNGAANDQFGTSVALSGTMAAVGALNKTVGANSYQGTAYVYDLTTPTAPVQKSILTASDGAANNFLGASVAVAGATVMVGSNGNNAVYAFQTGTTLACGAYGSSGPPGQQVAKMIASDGAASAQFGSGVVLSGNLAVIRAPIAQNNAGHAYVFDMTDPLNPVQKSILTASVQNTDSFSSSAAMSGTLAVIGASNTAVSGHIAQGTAYMFDLSGVLPASKHETSVLVPSDTVAGDRFGSGAALSGTLAVVGAYNKTVGANAGQGAAYVFDVSNPAIPVQKTKLTASDGTANAYFGNQAAMTGTTAVVAADNATVGANAAQGAVYVFDLSGVLPASKTQTSKITASDGAANDGFGIGVAMSGNILVVGAYAAKIGANAGQGAAYVYDVSNPASPVFKSKLTASDGAAGNEFGMIVAVSGNTALVGCVYCTIGGNANQGAAYVFDLTNPTAPVQISKLTISDGAASDYFGDVAVLGSTAVIGADGKKIGSNSSQGAVYVFRPNCVTAACATNGTCASSQGSLDYLTSGTYANLFQYCDGTNWVPVGASGSSSGGGGGGGGGSGGTPSQSCVEFAPTFTDQTGVAVSTLTSTSIVQVPVTAVCDKDVSIADLPSPITASDGANPDFFGASMAVSGNLAVVGASGKTIGANTWQGAAYVYDITNPLAPVQKSKLTAVAPYAGASFDEFGLSVAVSGNIAVIGSFRTGSTCGASPTVGQVCSDGSVYAGLSPDGSVQMATQRCDNGMTWDGTTCTGTALTSKWSTGNSVTTGYTNANTGQANTAALYPLSNADSPYSAAIACHNLNEDGHTDWYLPALNELNVLYTGAAAIGNFAGGAQAYWSSTEGTSATFAWGEVVGNGGGQGMYIKVAPAARHRCVRKVNGNSLQGSAYIFDLTNPLAPVQKSMITASDGAANTYFGKSVAISGSIAVVGAPATFGMQGAAYVYDLTNPLAPVQKSKLTASDGSVGDAFGNSVAMAGNIAVVGAGGMSAAYVFDLTNPAAPVQKSKITASDGTGIDSFSCSISISGTTVLVGACLKTVGANAMQGTVYIFDLTNPAAPVQTGEFTASDGAASDYFGSVSVSGTRAVVGAWNKTVGGHTSQGAAYAYDITNPAAPVETKLVYSNGAAGDYFGYSVAMSGTVPIVAAENKTVGINGNQGTAYIFAPNSQFRICSDAVCGAEVVTWGNAGQTVIPGQYLQTRLTSSASYATTNSATLTVGANSTTWNVTTIGPTKTVFITSTSTLGLIGTGGTAQADAICQTRSTAVGSLAPAGTYKAWIATNSPDDPVGRLAHNTGPYKLVDGTTIANNWTDLIDGTLAAPGINKDELGNVVANTVHFWSNVSATSGGAKSLSGSTTTCTGWTNSSGGSNKGNYGIAATTAAGWTDSGSNQTCSTAGTRLLCVQQ